MPDDVTLMPKQMRLAQLRGSAIGLPVSSVLGASTSLKVVREERGSEAWKRYGQTILD
ncbi:hypothetical protein [Microcoleus sp. FACHB-68]|uniref:hypothetical protein n=1 Tax=Microcoleus sp. FACHB-68 TaxID=2692826 RepID=UPI001684AFCC|nr:hypothetical protein [Microcoleus sp. FACHB-68]MBD1939289.1 hypothetical protein [Microcoleus sp. FACHB-68]